MQENSYYSTHPFHVVQMGPKSFDYSYAYMFKEFKGPKHLSITSNTGQSGLCLTE